MSRRASAWFSALLWAGITFPNPATAQSGVSLRASHQGEFLPEGTEVIILTRPGLVLMGDRHQPEFLAVSEFPRDRSLARFRDRLRDGGRSSRTYERTQDSGQLYFLYALTPDSVLYWSYSAQRDSLKFDVVSSGVMSVAPVASGAMRDEILRSNFAPRITVYMPNEPPVSREGSAQNGRHNTEPQPHETPPITTDDAWLSDTARAVSGFERASSVPDSTSFGRIAEQPASSDALPASDALRRGAGEGDSTRSAQIPVIVTSSASGSLGAAGSTLPVAGLILLGLLLALTAVVSFVRAGRYRNELKQVRREMLTLRHRAGSDARGDTRERRVDLERQLEQAELRYGQLSEEYAILQARYAALGSDASPEQAEGRPSQG